MIRFYILFVAYSIVKSLCTFSKFRKPILIIDNRKNATMNMHFWETIYGYNMIECT